MEDHAKAVECATTSVERLKALRGDIFDNIPRFGPDCRIFMRRKYG